MRILLAVPEGLSTVPMSAFSRDCLRQLGHQVKVISCRSNHLQKALSGLHLIPDIDTRAQKIIKQERWDLFLTLYGFELSAQTLGLLKNRGITSACWWLNDPTQIERSCEKAGLYDRYFTNAAGSVASYAQRGVVAYHLPTACAPELHRPVGAQRRYACDICFAGDWSPVRERLVESLVGRFNIRVFGPWGKKLAPHSPIRKVLTDGFFSPQQMVAMFSSSKIVLNLHSWYGCYSYGTNPRLFEAAACGAFQLSDWKEEIDQYFEEGKSIVTYRQIEDVPELVEEYLKKDELRQQIASRARTIAIEKHTYKHRMQTLLGYIHG
jgi:spore maturation protein CgeB